MAGYRGSYFRNGIAAVTLAEHHAILAAILDRDADGAAQSMRDASATVVGLSITA
jgi:DNA-binding GntR family transcriptional regulator